MTGDWAVNWPHEQVVWATEDRLSLRVLSFRAAEQRVLAEAGDHRRIEWGTAFLAGASSRVQGVVGDVNRCRDHFVATGLPTAEGLQHPPRKVAYIHEPVLAMTCALDLPPNGTDEETFLIGYDDEWSLELFGRRLRPWWRRAAGGETDPVAMLAHAMAERGRVLARAAAFDVELTARARAAAGDGYARLLSASWRQICSAHKLVEGPQGQPLLFAKENFSNGCVGTVDLTYPSAPVFLAHNPALLRAMLDPVFDYCAGPDWPYPFPAHDLGTYPLANGQTYRGYSKGGDNSIADLMPVEESGNMLVLAYAIARIEGEATYARRHWALLTKWAEYLEGVGYDPEEQLCTDDFSGHLASNVNLSAKACMGLGSYAALAAMLGEPERAVHFQAVAERHAADWLAHATDGEGTRLAFGQPGGWSVKYNLVWDRLLGLNLFPEEVLRREQQAYRRQLMPYGLPLDQRSAATMPQWMLWAASLAPDPKLFADLVERIERFLAETPNRVPFSDLWFADNARQIGFQARSILGGMWIALLPGWPDLTSQHLPTLTGFRLSNSRHETE